MSDLYRDSGGPTHPRHHHFREELIEKNYRVIFFNRLRLSIKQGLEIGTAYLLAAVMQ